MNMQSLHARYGFSLIEMLVYLSLTTLITLAGVLTYISLHVVLERNQTEKSVNTSAMTALERLSRDIQNGTSVNTIQSVFDSASGALAVVDGATTTRFSLSSGQLLLEVNGTPVGFLTDSDVTVDSFLVNRFVGTTTEFVRVALTLSLATKSASTTRTYYTSGVLRGSYE